MIDNDSKFTNKTVQNMTIHFMPYIFIIRICCHSAHKICCRPNHTLFII